MESQVCLIRWGTPKETYIDWYDYLLKQDYSPEKQNFVKWSDILDKITNFEILDMPRPNKWFADFLSRKIIFEKMIPYFKENIIFIWHSLGWSFLLKYLSEFDNCNLKNKAKKIILVAPALDKTPLEEIGTFRPNLEKIKLLNDYSQKIHIFASKDDEIVPFKQINMLKQVLPDANYHIFSDKGHFLTENFPELIKELKN